MARKRFRAIALVVLFAQVLLIWWLMSRQHRGIAKGPYLGVPEQRKRIDGIIRQLKSETLDESIDALVETQQYTYPCFHSPKLLAQTKLEEMLSARRSVKVLSGLEELPQDARATKCKEMFETFFQKNADNYRATMKRIEDRSPPDREHPVEATHQALCLAVFATAQFAPIETLAEQFTRLDEFRAAIERQLVAKQDSYLRIQRVVIREYCAPGPRFQMNVLRVAATRMPDVLSAVDRELVTVHREIAAIDPENSRFETLDIPIVAWDAHTTWFDIPRRMENIPIDTSKGVTHYLFYDWPGHIYRDWEQQWRVVQRIRKIVFGRAVGTR